ncbi:AEC family transporter [Boseongicola aestuarii]|uniref:Membrane transport protein n=1 Tax=Boseongicola aestuarii TaxID=1470561 RepID=A0A238IZ29_9RHOB|nr:AEC family transporter [Boseongicola aestuarii]SMX22924.1 Membrane transport protein [Boseongicola aestuarii]
MNLVLTVAEIVAPVFLLAALGFAWVKFGYEYRLDFVTKLAMTIGVPCLIFVTLMQADIEKDALTAVAGATIAAYSTVIISFFLISLAFKLDIQTFLAPLSFGNTGNLGLPLALFAFGDLGLGYAVVIFAVMAIISFTFGIWLVSGGGNPLPSLKEPLVGASIAGGFFLWMGWETPTFITNTLSLIGQLGIPLMLITLGVALARLSPSGIGRMVWLSGLKVVLCVAVAWPIGIWFELNDVAFAVLVLQVATPVAVTSYLLAEKYGADSDSVAGLVVVSTLMSVGFLPLILALVI